MNTYYKALVANGTKPEHAAFLAQRDELDRFANREHPNYGVYDPDDPAVVRQAYELKYGED